VVELECLPFSVGHGDEGICLLVRMGPYRILLDCGLKDISKLLQRPEILSPATSTDDQTALADLVLCSHAHSDHAQGLLALHQAFPQLPIYASEVTTQLLPLNWPQLDPAEPISWCQALPWRSPVELYPGLSVQLLPAGHLPGAAAWLLTYTPAQSHQPESTAVRPYTLLYTGDFFLSNARLVEGLHLEEFRGLAPDILITEGTFGTSRHPHRRSQENQLAERIHRALAQGVSVILPVPALGLGQELLMLLRSHHYFTGKDIDIWVDPTIAAGCDAYLRILAHLPSNVQNFARHQPLFWDERVRPRVRRLQSQRQLPGQAPCIVLADRQADFGEYCNASQRPWLLLFPQRVRQSSATGLDDPLTNLTQSLQAQTQAHLSVETYLLAQHSDGPGTTQLIHNLRPQHVVFVHGSPSYLADLASLDELNNRYHLHCPTVASVIELPIGETFLQPVAPEAETSYEGELVEIGTTVTITLPDAIAADPRFPSFADTGLVEARWQGEELVLRGISQRELLLSRVGPAALDPDLKHCANCQYYRGQRCWNPASSLLGFKVAPEGYCPVFEPIQRQNTDLDPSR